VGRVDAGVSAASEGGGVGVGETARGVAASILLDDPHPALRGDPPHKGEGNDAARFGTRADLRGARLFLYCFGTTRTYQAPGYSSPAPGDDISL
jgi:hypothetical protein